MQENKKLVGYMTYEELNTLVEATKEYVRKNKVFDDVNTDVMCVNRLEIYDLDTFLDELEHALDYFEAQNVSWKINNARTATGVSQTVSVNYERWLRRLWNFLNDEDCVPADIGICVLPAMYEYAENERFLCAQIVFVENHKYTKGAGGLALYHNRETNKCSLKVINGLCVNVTHIDAVCARNVDYAALEFAPVKELWRLCTDIIPKTDAALGVNVSLVTSYAKYETLLYCLNDDKPNDSMIASMLREIEEQYTERYKVHVIKTYCPICGKDCYNRIDEWFTGGSEGCNAHAGQLSYTLQKCADLYIDYKDGKFLINNRSTHATVCKASEPVTVACALDKWRVLKNDYDIVATVKQCVDCGNAFVITKRFDRELKSHGWNQPCKCSKCRGKKEWLVLNGVWQYRI